MSAAAVGVVSAIGCDIVEGLMVPNPLICRWGGLYSFVCSRLKGNHFVNANYPQSVRSLRRKIAHGTTATQWKVTERSYDTDEVIIVGQPFVVEFCLGIGPQKKAADKATNGT